MHATIFQITEDRISEKDFIDERTFEEGEYNFYDYCSAINDSERMDAIDNLVTHFLPANMFSLDDNNKDVIVYNGGAADWKRNWVNRIQQKAKDITPENVTEWLGSIHQLEQELTNPLDVGSRFVTDDYKSTDAMQSGEFMKFVCNLKVGAKLYIGGVLDFHW